MKMNKYLTCYRAILLIMTTGLMLHTAVAATADIGLPNIEIDQDIYISNDLPDGALTKPVEAEIVAYSATKPDLNEKYNQFWYGDFEIYNLPNGYKSVNDESPIINLIDDKNTPVNSDVLFVGISYRLTLRNTNETISGLGKGYYHDLNFFNMNRSSISQEGDKWVSRTPVTIQFFKRGKLDDAFAKGNVRYLLSNMSILYFKTKGFAGKLFPDIIITPRIHYISSAKTLDVSDGVFTSQDNLDIDHTLPTGTLLGAPLQKTFSLPWPHSGKPRSVQFTALTPYTLINGISVYKTDVRGIGYKLTSQNGKDLTPEDGVLNNGTLEFKAALQFVKTDDINPGSTITELKSLGTLTLITSDTPPVMYKADGLSFKGLLTIDAPALGCD